MAQVDPFLLPIPRALRQDKETRVFMEYLVRWNHDMWQRTGGGDDAISEVQIGELYEPGIQVSNADELIDELLAEDDAETIALNERVDEIENSDSFNVDLSERIDEIEAELEQLNFSVDYDAITESVAGSVVVTSSAYTTTSNQTVIAESNITITLNDSPSDNERVTAKRATAAGTVTVDGNGKNIDGTATADLLSNYETITVIYSATNDEWLII